MMQFLLFPLACLVRLSATDVYPGIPELGAASNIYARAPWTNEGDFVSLETHPDGTPFVPVPGDGGLCGAIHTEVENFTIVTVPGKPAPFVVTEWGRDHYYGATFENTFAHSKALLHSTNQSIGTAHGTMDIPTSATYYVAVRYEAAYRFETEFMLTISGAGTFTKMYGQRESPKLWAFGWSENNHKIGGCDLDPTPECHWTWGATENWVTEYYPVQLSAGTANFEISITNTTSKPGMAPMADRNIDAIVLTTNLSDIKMRALNEQGSVPMDGLYTQRNKVFMKVTNNGNEDMNLNIPFAAYHSSYAPMHMFCIPYCVNSSNGKVYDSVAYLDIPVPKGATTPKWVEVGSRLDTMNDMTWEFTAIKYVPPGCTTFLDQADCIASAANPMGGYACSWGVDPKHPGGTCTFSPPPKPTPAPPGPAPPPKPPPPPFAPSYTVQFGVMENGNVVPISTDEVFSTTTAYLQVALDASVTNFKRIRRPDDSLYAALAEAKNVTMPATASAPTLTPIFGYTFCTSGNIRDLEPFCFLNTSLSANYEKTYEEFMSFFPISDSSADGVGLITPYQKAHKTGYFEARDVYTSPTHLKYAMGNLTATGDADDYMVVSMGDEIQLPVPPGAVGAAQFQTWMAATYPGVHVAVYNDTICYDPKTCNPATHYYSNLFSDAYGLSVLTPATKTITAALKNAGVGANYSPLDYNPHGFYTQFQYWYPVNKAVTIYRKQAMTLPWSEDYTWQSPIGTQQMTTILHDLNRAGLRGVDNTPATSRMMAGEK